MKAICSRCLTTDHELHKIIDIEDQHKRYLTMVQKGIEDVTKMYNELSNAKSQMEIEFDSFQSVMESTKNVIIQSVVAIFSIYEIVCEGMKTENALKMQQNVDFLQEKISILHDISRESKIQYTETYDLDLIENIIQSAQSKLETKLNIDYQITEIKNKISTEICCELAKDSDEFKRRLSTKERKIAHYSSLRKNRTPVFPKFFSK